MANEKHACEIKSQFCSGELMARYTFKKRRGDPEDPPKFWCCGACRVAGLRGVKLVQIPEEVPSAVV